MEKIVLSHEAYEEFKSFLDENKVESYNIRIDFAGSGCSGPSFNISVGEKEEDDIVEQVKDITFLIKPELIDEFGVFTILSEDENEGRGLSLRPLIEPVGGCGGCTGCH
jgi:iron-sulfur cluster insertion protein